MGKTIKIDVRGIVSEMPARNFFSFGMRWQSALCMGIIAAALFATLSSSRLTAQGLYYDELHQAAASFAYIGTAPLPEIYMFATLTIHGIPVLNMNYSGAIKTGLYGIYLRYFGSHFSVLSWRLLGIIFVSTGIFLFTVIVYRKLPLIWLLSFLFLFLTDITVILGSRHDWGPIALAMLFRLLFIATWIRGEIQGSISAKNSLLLGSLVGISIFEKLSSVVLVLPLIVIFIFSLKRRTFRHWLACIAGGILGGMPLIFVNLYTLWKYGTLISFTRGGVSLYLSFLGFLKYIFAYLSLGSGPHLKRFILGTDSVTSSYAEGMLLGIILLVTAITAVHYWNRNNFFRMSGIMTLCYIAVGLTLYILPSPTWAHHTWVHHWIIGTPFQYAAISFALIGFQGVTTNVNPQWRFSRTIFISIFMVLMISRLLGIISIEKSFYHREASINWDSSLTEMGRFASKRANDAIFIAADWGVATQIFCLSNGRPDLVYELFWNYQGADEIKNLVQKRGKKIVYIVNKKPNTDVNPDNTTRILRDMETLTDWMEIPVEDEIAALRAVKIRKFLNIAKDKK